MPHDNFLNLFKVRARDAKAIFVCCFRDPRGLLSRERDTFHRQTIEVRKTYSNYRQEPILIGSCCRHVFDQRVPLII